MQDQDGQNNNKIYSQFCSNLTDRIGRIMEKHKLKIIYKPTTKLKDMLHSVKDAGTHYPQLVFTESRVHVGKCILEQPNAV